MIRVALCFVVFAITTIIVTMAAMFLDDLGKDGKLLYGVDYFIAFVLFCLYDAYALYRLVEGYY